MSTNIFKIDEILKNSNFSIEDDIEKNISLFLYEMQAGIDRSAPSSFAMQHTFSSPLSFEKATIKNEKIIVIDLGGSNLRSACVCFDEEGEVHISKRKICKTFTKQTYKSTSSFFSSLAKNISYLKNESSLIAFCFSYAIEFLSSGNAIVQSLSKDLSVEGIEGKNVGEELKKALISEGWLPSLKIFVLNDTVAALYAALYKKNKSFSSYISYILGTGLNVAYTERKNENSSGEVLILEAGAYDKISMSEFDRNVISASKEGMHHILEKMCSSHYLGAITLEILKKSAYCNVFSKKFALYLLEDESLMQQNLWEHFNNLYFQKNYSPTFTHHATEEDFKAVRYILMKVIERVANISSSLISACCIKNKLENTKDSPIAIVVEGGTVLKTYKLYSLINAKLTSYMQKHDTYFELKTIEDATFIGSAIAEQNGAKIV